MYRKWDIMSKEKQQKCLEEIITRIEEIENSAVGVIAAQDIIDIVSENLGPEIYNKAVNDTAKILKERFLDIETELDLLEQS